MVSHFIPNDAGGWHIERPQVGRGGHHEISPETSQLVMAVGRGNRRSVADRVHLANKAQSSVALDQYLNQGSLKL